MRYHRHSYTRIKAIAIATIVALAGAAFFFSREMPPLHQKVVKAIDVGKFIK